MSAGELSFGAPQSGVLSFGIVSRRPLVLLDDGRMSEMPFGETLQPATMPLDTTSWANLPGMPAVIAAGADAAAARAAIGAAAASGSDVVDIFIQGVGAGMPEFIDKVRKAMAVNSTRLAIDKANLTSQTAGAYCSLWRSNGQPTPGAIPTAAATCNETTTGGLPVAQQTAPVRSFLTYMEWASSNSACTLELHDRLAAMGGLVGNVTTAQAVGLDLDAMLATDNIAERIGDADYSDVQWWLEWYGSTGSTASSATVNVTYADGSTGNLSVAALAATRGAAHCISLNSLRPASASGAIRGVNTVTLSASTGTAGNFGVTATRLRGGLMAPIANAKFSANYDDLPIGEVPQKACLALMVLTTTTSSGTVRGGGKVSHIDPT